MLGMARQQELLGHVEREKRSHPVIREALPHLGEGQVGEAFRMAEKAVGAKLAGGNGSRAQSGFPDITDA